MDRHRAVLGDGASELVVPYGMAEESRELVVHYGESKVQPRMP